MTEYAICFDFPEDERQFPWFAHRMPGGWGLAMRLENAERFVSEEAAERTLKNAFGEAMRQCGVVVELAQ